MASNEQWYRVECCNRLESVAAVTVVEVGRSVVTLADGTTQKKTGRTVAYRPSREEAISWAITVLKKQYDRANRRAQQAGDALGHALRQF